MKNPLVLPFDLDMEPSELTCDPNSIPSGPLSLAWFRCRSVLGAFWVRFGCVLDAFWVRNGAVRLIYRKVPFFEAYISEGTVHPSGRRNL